MLEELLLLHTARPYSAAREIHTKFEATHSHGHQHQ